MTKMFFLSFCGSIKRKLSCFNNLPMAQKTFLMKTKVDHSALFVSQYLTKKNLEQYSQFERKHFKHIF